MDPREPKMLIEDWDVVFMKECPWLIRREIRLLADPSMARARVRLFLFLKPIPRTRLYWLFYLTGEALVAPGHLQNTMSSVPMSDPSASVGLLNQCR